MEEGNSDDLYGHGTSQSRPDDRLKARRRVFTEVLTNLLVFVLKLG